MNKLIILFLLLPCCHPSFAQYYYKDIISNKQLSAEMKLYKEKKIREIKLNSFEYDSAPSDDFFCEKRISKDFKKVELFTKASGAATSLFTSIFNDNGNLVRSTDSSEIALTHNFYYYDESGRVTRIVSSVKSSDDDFTSEIHEEHIYQYNEEGIPASMIKVKNKRDSIRVLFQTDEQNNVAIEKETKSGSKYYYYYDSKNNLTDVVHANEYRENLVAVYLFKYNAAGQMTEMTTTEEGTNNYFIWVYNYDDGLRSRERLFSKEKKLLGRIEYEYKER